MNSEVLLNEIAARFIDLKDEQGIDGLLKRFLDLLEAGTIRSAYPSPTGWIVDERVKKGILLAFHRGKKKKVSVGPLSFIDKHNLWPRNFDLSDDVRILPTALVRRGAYVGKNVAAMPPSFVNIGAFVDDGCLIDSHALVGSCAQIGKRVHISAGAQIGGVLEPVGAVPIIIGDDVLIGGNCGLYEGVEVSDKAVLGAGVIITKSTKIYDLVHERIIAATEPRGLTIPKNAILVPGSRSLTSDFAKSHGIAVTCPLIIKYRDEQTDKKTRLEDLLR